VLIPKQARRFTCFDNKVIALYGRDLTVRERMISARKDRLRINLMQHHQVLGADHGMSAFQYFLEWQRRAVARVGMACDGDPSRRPRRDPAE
jgi:hypothetical protein